MASSYYLPREEDPTSTGSAQSAFHERAAAIRHAQFGNEVFVRAVVEVSNHCREQRAYCDMRRDKRALGRYRAQAEHYRNGNLKPTPTSAGAS